MGSPLPSEQPHHPLEVVGLVCRGWLAILPNHTTLLGRELPREFSVSSSSKSVAGSTTLVGEGPNSEPFIRRGAHRGRSTPPRHSPTTWPSPGSAGPQGILHPDLQGPPGFQRRAVTSSQSAHEFSPSGCRPHKQVTRLSLRIHGGLVPGPIRRRSSHYIKWVVQRALRIHGFRIHGFHVLGFNQLCTRGYRGLTVLYLNCKTEHSEDRLVGLAGYVELVEQHLKSYIKCDGQCSRKMVSIINIYVKFFMDFVQTVLSVMLRRKSGISAK